MKQVFARPAVLRATPTHYCPGCTHGIAHRLVAEVIDELGIRGRTIGVASVCCSVFAYDYLDVDFQQAAHGRAAAVATGIKQLLPDRVVFTYRNFIEDRESPAPESAALASVLTGEVRHLLAVLTPRERKVVRLRFGLEGERPHTLAEVGHTLRVSRERVRQIERDALRKLLPAAQAKRLGNFVAG